MGFILLHEARSAEISQPGCDTGTGLPPVKDAADYTSAYRWVEFGCYPGENAPVRPEPIGFRQAESIRLCYSTHYSTGYHRYEYRTIEPWSQQVFGSLVLSY